MSDGRAKIPVKIVYDDGSEADLSRVGWLGRDWHVTCHGPFYTAEVVNLETGLRLAVESIEVVVNNNHESWMLLTVPRAHFDFEVRQGVIFPVREKPNVEARSD